MQISWTRRADKSLEYIEEYIAQDNKIAALETISKIIQAVEHLRAHSHLGKTGRILGTRELIIPSTPYIVPYRVKNEYIEILSVLHSAMEWPDNL